MDAVPSRMDRTAAWVRARATTRAPEPTRAARWRGDRTARAAPAQAYNPRTGAYGTDAARLERLRQLGIDGRRSAAMTGRRPIASPIARPAPPRASRAPTKARRSAATLAAPGGGFVAAGDDGNVYAGRDGNVYKNDGGGWQKHENGEWSDANRPTPQTADQLDKRSRGTHVGNAAHQ